MKIKNWIACVQDRGKWKEVVEKSQNFQLGSSVPGKKKEFKLGFHVSILY
jgi:hypothetical protein